MMDSVLFIADRSMVSELAAGFLELRTRRLTKLLWDYGDHPTHLPTWSGDWIISFKSDIVLTAEQLNRARLGALNIHPAPPHYRGIGGYRFAIEGQDPCYGATCHRMDERIDAGPIVLVRRFPLHRSETTESLKLRTGFECLSLLGEVVETICSHQALPTSDETWTGKLHQRRDLVQQSAAVA